MPQQSQPVSVTFKNPATGADVTVGFDARPYPDGARLMRKVTALHWHYIQTGWGENEVRLLLGGPTQIKFTRGPDGQAVSVWKYGRGLWGFGTVTFRDGTVVGYKAPSPSRFVWVYHGPVEGG